MQQKIDALKKMLEHTRKRWAEAYKQILRNTLKAQRLDAERRRLEKRLLKARREARAEKAKYPPGYTPPGGFSK